MDTTTAHSMRKISFNASNHDDPLLKQLAQSVLKAKRIAVVCGAGISCASGIPDFRSPAGLFETLKNKHPQAKLSSGKDLFDASLFSSETNAALFYTMIGELKTLTDDATPTPFHRFLKSLDEQGRLFRVYTQNIDGLEERVGLSYGLGPASLPPRRSQPSSSAPTPSPRPSSPSPSSSPLPSSVIPRCIPLHGHLGTLSCPCCSHTVPLAPHTDLLRAGTTLACPSCTTTDETRAAMGERSRGVGRMKPDVVLYGETHKEGERVGEITRRDLLGQRPDLLIVVGTSLKVPGTKLLVRELGRVIRPAKKEKVKKEGEAEPQENDKDDLDLPTPSGSTSMSFSSSQQPSQSNSTTATTTRKPRIPKPDPIHTVYLNLEFPTPAREWKDVFDLWAQGDIQEFVQVLLREKEEEEARVEKRRREKEAKEARKREKERMERQREKDGVVVVEGGKKKGKVVLEVVGKKKVPAKVTTTTTTATKQKGLGFAITNKSNSSTSTSTTKPIKPIKPLPPPRPSPAALKLPSPPITLPTLPTTLSQRVTRSRSPLSTNSSLTPLTASDVSDGESEISSAAASDVSVASRTRGRISLGGDGGEGERKRKREGGDEARGRGGMALRGAKARKSM